MCDLRPRRSLSATVASGVALGSYQWKGSNMNLINLLKTFCGDEDGVTAIEYGLIAALIAILIIVGATAVGVQLDIIFNYVAGKLVT